MNSHKTFISFFSLFFGVGATFRTTTNNQGTGTIVLANLRCVGNETSLFFCAGATIGSNTCTHSQDVEVTCRCKFQDFLYFLPDYEFGF